MDKLLGCYAQVIFWVGFVVVLAAMFGWEFVIIEAIGLAVLTIAAFAWAAWKGRHL